MGSGFSPRSRRRRGRFARGFALRAATRPLPMDDSIGGPSRRRRCEWAASKVRLLVQGCRAIPSCVARLATPDDLERFGAGPGVPPDGPNRLEPVVRRVDLDAALDGDAGDVRLTRAGVGRDDGFRRRRLLEPHRAGRFGRGAPPGSAASDPTTESLRRPAVDAVEPAVESTRRRPAAGGARPRARRRALRVSGGPRADDQARPTPAAARSRLRAAGRARPPRAAPRACRVDLPQPLYRVCGAGRGA